MIRVYSSSLLQQKLGRILSFFAEQAGVSLAVLEKLMIENAAFDFPEQEREMDRFVKNGVEDFYEKVFSAACPYRERASYDPALFWAGMAYMVILQEDAVPLRQSFLQCPLREMLSLFPVYHESGWPYFLKMYRERYESKNVLKLYLNRKGADRDALADLLGVSRSGFYRLLSKQRIVEASSGLYAKLAALIDYPNVFSLEYSHYLRYGEYLFQEDLFLSDVLSCLSKLLDEPHLKEVSFGKNGDGVISFDAEANPSKGKKAFLCLAFSNPYLFLEKEEGRKEIYFPEEILETALRYALLKRAERCRDDI